MSCNCNYTGSDNFPCPCDDFVFPPKLVISAGLRDLPRQLAGFPEFRRAMLFAIRPQSPLDGNKHALDAWKARQPDDLGMMMIEMWAYICDSLCFYDKVIAQEEYLRTALQRPSLRKLVALLGYLPRPAIGSFVTVEAQADSKSLVTIPMGTGFRSAAFGSNPPQVFEVDTDTTIHPLTNSWTVRPPQSAGVTDPHPQQLMILPQINIAPDQAYLIADSANNLNTQAAWVPAVTDYTGNDQKLYKNLSLAVPANLPPGYPMANLQLMMPLHTAGLWTATYDGPSTVSVSADAQHIVLDGQYREIKSGQYLMVSKAQESRWFTVQQVNETTRHATAGEAIVVNGTTFNSPGASVPVTVLTLDCPLNDPSRISPAAATWSDSDKATLTVYFALQLCGNLTNGPQTVLTSDNSNPIFFNERAEQPFENFDPSQFLLTDKNDVSMSLGGMLNYSASSLQPNMNQLWDSPLTLPVNVYGNLIKASRGQTVSQEILGSGDATLANQTFKLKNKPLTYFPAPAADNIQGIKNTLQVYINGIQWKEVPSFYNIKDSQQVYIVRQDDNGDSWITFGDGKRGMRLISGDSNIVANYRYGAEAAAPPAATVTQIVKSAKGLSSVSNPLPATGGDDAQPADGLRTYAPASILTLGRIVSIQDIDAVARTVAGVRAVQVEWRWQGEMQCPVVQIWYIGDNDITATVKGTIIALADPSILISVQRAQAFSVPIEIDVELDPKYFAADVKGNVMQALTNTSSGLLAPEVMGIGQPLFRSKIFAAILAVPGVVAVRNIEWNGISLTGFAKSPDAGTYFDFSGKITLTVTQ